MVGAGEASGTLETVLERLADYMESQSKLRGKVGAAMAYPALMMVIGSGLITVMMVVVVPKMTAIFESMDQALPWYTELLIGVSHFIASNQMLGFVLGAITLTLVRMALRERTPAAPGAKPRLSEEDQTKQLLLVVVSSLFGVLLILAAFSVDSFGLYALGVAAGVVVGLGIAWVLAWVATPAGRAAKDGFILKVPVLGALARMLAVSRFARTLATLLRSGVPLLKAMEIVKSVLDNGKLEQVIETAAGSIREGESIAGPLKRSGDFPPIVTHMIAVGERSGQLEPMLENVARAYDSQVETRVQALTSLLEPLMIVVMGGSVGFIAFAILMPFIQMNEFMQQ
jgi:general secretion pathway protein F